MKAAKIFWGIGFIVLLIIILGFTSFHLLSYNDLLAYAMNSLQRPDLESSLRNKYFTIVKYDRLRKLSLLAIPLLTSFLAFLYFKRKTWWLHIHQQLKYLSHYSKTSIQIFKNTTRPTRISFFVIISLIAIRSIYYALHFYPQYDECWNYNYFLSNSPLTTIVAWNNYPLHNLISSLFINVLPDAALVMRIPSILFGLLSSTLVFITIQKTWRNEMLALIAVALFAALPLNVFYFLFARGVMLAIFFGIILFYFLIIKGINKSNILLMSLCAALGSYSMLSFPIYLLAIIFASCLISFIYKRKDFKHIILFAVMAAGLSLLLVSPFLIGSGIGLGLESGYVNNTLNIQHIIDNIQLNSFLFIGSFYGAYICLGVNIILLFVLKKEKPIIIASICILLIELFMPLFSQVFLPARALGFIVISYFFTIILALFFLSKIVDKKVALLVSSISIIGLSIIAHKHPFLNWSSVKDKEVHTIAQILKENNISHYYNRTPAFTYYVPGISYYYKTSDKPLTYATNNTKSTRFTKEIPLDAQAIIVALDSVDRVEKFTTALYKNNSFIILKKEF